jgi:hypothetical protein
MVLSLLLFRFIGGFQDNLEELHGTPKLLVHADVHLFGENTHHKEKHTDYIGF